MSIQRIAITALAATAFAAATLSGSAPTASALNTALGYAGICTGSDALTGTTIVIDFQELNGNGGTAAPTITRCSPNPTQATRTGLKAMQDAGISVTGTTRWGLGFICRLEGRPSASESLPITSNTSYKEACVNTPPAAAYWSYWWANGSGSTWTYSASGASGRSAVPGGFEGWSFSLNKTASTNPVPRVTPRNPAVGSSAPVVALSISSLTGKITLGQSVDLTWSSSNTTSQAASVTPTTGGGAWSGALATAGVKTITPTAKGTYTYVIKGTGTSTVTSSVTLTVA